MTANLPEPVREALSRFDDLIGAHGNKPDADALTTLETEFAALTARVADTERLLASALHDNAMNGERADRLAALAGAAPVAWMVEWPDEDDDEPIRIAFEYKRGAENRAAEFGPSARVFPLFTHAPAKAREDDGMDERDAAELLRLRYAMGERLKLADATELLRAAVSPSGADFCMCPELERRIEAFVSDAALATFAEGME